MNLWLLTVCSKWGFSALAISNLSSSPLTINKAACIMSLSMPMADGKLMSLMTIFPSMNIVDSQFGVWIWNSHGRLFSWNVGQRDYLLLLKNQVRMLSKEVIMELRIQHLLSLWITLLIPIGSFLTYILILISSWDKRLIKHKLDSLFSNRKTQIMSSKVDSFLMRRVIRFWA